MNSSYQGDNTEIRKQIIECSILIISLLLQKYKSKEIDIIDFKNHTISKINYIMDNFDVIKDTLEIEKVESLINECNEIFNAN